MTLNEAQKKYLRGLGHQKKPLIIVGAAGLSASLLAEFESTLSHHELGDRETRDSMIEKLCSVSAAELVQRIGNVALLYRENPDKPATKRLRLPSQ